MKLDALARLALLTLLSACGSAAPAPAAPSAGGTSTCEALVARYRATVAAGTFACGSDADCVAYGGIDPDDLCGGATDVETGRALSLVTAEMDAAGCPRPGYSCPAIELRCRDGSCR